MTIGEKIKEIFKQLPKNCDIEWFANQLHCERRNIYRIFQKTNIDIEQLRKISEILNYNFFAFLSEEYEKKELTSNL